MKLASILLLFSLVGCSATIPIERPVLVKIERIVTPIPNELLAIPDQVPSLTNEQLTKNDKAVAQWLLDSELRTVTLEEQLRKIRDLYRKQLIDTALENSKK